MNEFDFDPPQKAASSVLNWRGIARVLAVLLGFEALLLSICSVVGWWYGESDVPYFLYTILALALASGLLLWASRGADRHLTRKDGYFIVSVTWVLFTLFGMMPFWLSGYIPTVTDAFFEMMSGFTTTGATILDHIESLPHGLLFWRSFSQWIGGLGIVFFTIAFLPFISGGGNSLYFAEATGVKHDRIVPKIEMMAKWIWTVYILLTALETLLLVGGNMSWFDALCHSFSTTATGGYSTKQDSIAYWNSPYIEYVVSVFMILSGINFSLFLHALKRRYSPLFKDHEVRWFLASVLVLTVGISVALVVRNGYAPEMAFRKALFQVATAHTSCGFATDDYNLWPPFTWLLLVYAMIAGGCTGSTSGGVKNMRVMIVAKCIRNSFRQMLHPQAVVPIRVDGAVVDISTLKSVCTFVLFYLFCVFVGMLLLMIMGVGLLESLGTVVSAIGNVGPGLGSFGPAYSWAALPDGGKWVLSFLMLIGRLELFCVLLLFYKGFWKHL